MRASVSKPRSTKVPNMQNGFNSQTTKNWPHAHIPFHCQNISSPFTPKTVL